MSIFNDKRIVMTLDAGGTNFVFSALQGGNEIVAPIILPSSGDNLNLSLQTIIEGFTKIKSKLKIKPVAISFAFPGPADYPNGIIGDLGNLPAYRNGIALGPMLQDKFGIPVFINNDGDLFAYGEAMAGILPKVNSESKKNKQHKEYRNLLGITIGTGFGAGIVINNQLCTGDNSAAGEIWLTRNYLNSNTFAEEGVSIRAIKRYYLDNSLDDNVNITSERIYNIAIGINQGDQEAAVGAFEHLARNLAESLANAILLIDGIIVIGGGISAAHELFLSKVVNYMNGTIENIYGDKKIPRLVSSVHNLMNVESSDAFYKDESEKVRIPFSNKFVRFNSVKKIAIGLSEMGTSRAIAFGAYYFAIKRI